MAIDYVTLRLEIEQDPQGLGYAGKTDPEIAAVLNLVRAAIKIDRTAVSGAELLASVEVADFKTLSAAQQQLFLAFTSAQGTDRNGNINIKAPLVRASLLDMFGSATPTRANLVALQQRSASRAEQLFGENVQIGAADVAIALRGR